MNRKDRRDWHIGWKKWKNQTF